MRKRGVTDEELDMIGREAAPGDVWWCRGDSLCFADGGKVRPVLVVSIGNSEVVVVPMTTRKPHAGAVAVAHAGGQSWLTSAEIAVPRLDLVSNLGSWTGFDAWRRMRR